MDDAVIDDELRTHFVPVKLDDGTIIRVEGVPLSPSSSDDEYISVELPSFEEITKTIKSISSSLVNVWQEVQPKKASVEFALEVGFEPGHITALLVKGSGKANLKITLEWEHPTAETLTTTQN